LVKDQGIELLSVPYSPQRGHIDLKALAQFTGQDIAALVVPQPNFFGVIEPADELAAWAKKNGMLTIAVVNPTSLALLRPPGEWGADIAVGDGQPLGVPLANGGPYFGFIACRQEYVRQMPGRIIGATVDVEGKTGYALTLQAREQHIRRSKATSNICTNQGLAVTAATIYMALVGPDGLARVAQACHANTLALAQKLTAIPGVTRAFNGAVFHEFVLKLDAPVDEVLKALRAQHILGGVALTTDYPELGNALLVCATETKRSNDFDLYETHLKSALAAR
jgi:glycine dehydrogenase subunit 1